MHKTGLIRPPGRLKARLAVLGALVVLAALPSTARTALAQTGSPAETESALAADIDVGSSGLDAEQLRAAIARELGVNVRLSVKDESPALRVRLGNGRRATVRFQPPGERALERTVELPADPEPAYETVALLAGNLARNEASELLAQLRRPAPSEPEPASEDGSPTSETPKPEPAAPAPRPNPKPKALPAPSKATPATTKKPDEPQLKSAPVNLSVFFPLALYRDSHKRRVAGELGLLYSEVGAISGVGVTLGHLRLRHELEGALFTLALNRVDGHTLGAQISVGGNLSGGALRGADVAVGFNHRAGHVKGAQLAVGYNHAPSIEGAQLGGFNENDGIEGAELGLVNSASGAGGLQGGLVNTAGELSGVQLGLVNVGTHVRGVQIGLVNVADKVDGASVGIVNVVGDARTRVVGWVDSSARGNIGIKYQHAFLFTLISGGYRLNRLTEPQGKLLEPAFAFGGHMDFGPAFAELDVQYAFRQSTDEDAFEKHISRYRLTLGYDPVRKFGGFIGGAVEQVFERGGSSVGGLLFAGFQLF